MNSSRAIGCQPQNMQRSHAGSMARLHCPHIRAPFEPFFPLFATEISRNSPSRVETMMMPTSTGVSISASLVDRLEHDVGLTERDHVVVDEVMAIDLLVVDERPVGRLVVLDLEARRRADDLTVLGAHEPVLDDDVDIARVADLGDALE